MLWFLLWLALVACAVALLSLLGLRLWRQTKALTAELAAASDRLAEITVVMTESTASRDTGSSHLR